MKALTGLSQAPFDPLLPVFRDLYRATPQQTYEAGSHAGTRRRPPGGGATGTLPTMAETLPFVLYSSNTSPPVDVLGTQWALARLKAHENRPTRSPRLSDTLGHLDLMPDRAWATPEELTAALHGGDRLLMEATERAEHRWQDAAKQRAQYSGKKTRIAN